MKWIGNDIVDLNQAAIESNWQRKGYLQKLFTAEEQKLIESAAAPSTMLWLFWSMKEAAYKIDNRLTAIRNFAPRKLACSFTNLSANSASGSVSVNQNFYFTQSTFNENYVHTVAVIDESDFEQITFQIHDVPHPNDFRETHPNCISHHGRFLALAYLLGKS